MNIVMKKILICVLGLILLSTAYYFLHLYALRMSEIYVENKKSTLQKEFYDKLNEYWGGESRLMYSEEYGNSSYIPMDMDAVRFIDDRSAKDIGFYSSVERLFPYDRFPLLTSTMFKCLKPGCFEQLYELNAVKTAPWQALLLKYKEKDEFQVFIFLPVAVGYLQSAIYMKDWRPSLDKSCEEALEYLVKEDKDYKGCYNPNNKRTIKNILALYNQYYYLQQKGHFGNGYEDDDYINFEEIWLSPNPEGEPQCGHQISWIYNGFYRVYYDVYPYSTYEVSFNYYNYNNDKEIYYDKYFSVIRISLRLLLVLLFVYLSYLLYNYYQYLKIRVAIDSGAKEELRFLIFSPFFLLYLSYCLWKKWLERWKIWKRREEAPFCGVDRHRMGTDGNGITTLVVFHDCPLRCKYCLNPQTLGPRYEDAVYYIPKELYQEVKKDNLYFLSTHGGITFGGGEPCLYSRFICKFRLQCGPSWRLTVETSLNVPQGDLESLLDVVDYYIVDIKDMDASKYRQYTGEDNCRVIDNLRFLLEHGKSDSILVRVPLIPHYNTTTDVENNVRILKDMGVSHFDRLTYQVQEEVGGKLTKLTGKLQDYESRKKGWLERLERAVFDIE